MKGHGEEGKEVEEEVAGGGGEEGMISMRFLVFTDIVGKFYR